MKKAKKKVIQINFNGDEGIINKNIKVVVEGFFIYFNAQHLLTQLNRSERAFFDFLCEEMKQDDNVILIDANKKSLFIDRINDITSGKINPSSTSLNQYVSTFNTLGLIIPINEDNNMLYYINPRHFFKGTEGRRLILIKEIIEKRIKERRSLKGLIDVPEEDFLKPN